MDHEKLSWRQRLVLRRSVRRGRRELARGGSPAGGLLLVLPSRADRPDEIAAPLEKWLRDPPFQPVTL
ncbi:MAG TPA: hypothetical protein ENI92_06135, partial [Bacteroidetes bacterium]|nr:hypothetical protein [Bacteroidota bacterium]